MNKISWDEYFINITKAVSLKSEDPSNKIGAIIVGISNEIRSTGYNGFPRGLNHDPIKQERPLKYKYFEHAERNAIYNASRFGAKTNNCTMYCLWPPCTSCARAIIQSGISRLVVNKSIIDCPERWQDDFTLAVNMLKECNITFEVNNFNKGD